MRSAAFKPIMISFDNESYEAAKERASEKLRLLHEAENFIQLLLKVEAVNLKKLSYNMVNYFKDLMLETFKDKNTLGLSADKLIEAKEIELHILIALQKHYDNMPEQIDFSLKRPRVKVSRRTYETWTTNEKQNKRLLAGNKIISALKDLEKETAIAKFHVNRLTNGYVIFNSYKNDYFVNPEMLQV